jgi:single stranded DNA-binding protein|tara:strand:+ start:310 stop:669 length:360 start_codon:yes stop_codon:yes gene_type:complete
MEKSTNNFCRLEGNIGSEIKISNLPNEEGTPVTNFSLAVNTFIKRNNEFVTETDWFDCSFLGNENQEFIQHAAAKGSRVMVYGRLKITTSIKDGVKRNFINVQGHDIDILSSKKVQNEI